MSTSTAAFVIPPERTTFAGWRPPLIAGDLSGATYQGTLGPVTVLGRIVGTEQWWITAASVPAGDCPGLASSLEDTWLRYFLRVGPRPGGQ